MAKSLAFQWGGSGTMRARCLRKSIDPNTAKMGEFHVLIFRFRKDISRIGKYSWFQYTSGDSSRQCTRCATTMHSPAPPPPPPRACNSDPKQTCASRPWDLCFTAFVSRSSCRPLVTCAPTLQRSAPRRGLVRAWAVTLAVAWTSSLRSLRFSAAMNPASVGGVFALLVGSPADDHASFPRWAFMISDSCYRSTSVSVGPPSKSAPEAARVAAPLHVSSSVLLGSSQLRSRCPTGARWVRGRQLGATHCNCSIQAMTRNTNRQDGASRAILRQTGMRLAQERSVFHGRP